MNKVRGANLLAKKFPKVKPNDLVKQWNIVKGDLVEIIAGQGKGEQAKVVEVLRKENRVILEGKKLVSKHVKKTDDNQGGIFKVASSIHLSNVQLVDPSSLKPSKIRIKLETDPITGKAIKTRIAKDSGAEIPKPLPDLSYMKKRKEAEGPFDTKPEDVHQLTYIPQLNVCPFPKDMIWTHKRF